MNDEATGWLAGLCACAAIAVVLWAVAFSWKCDIEKLKNEAVTHNCAEYFIDGQNNLQWRWKDNK